MKKLIILSILALCLLCYSREGADSSSVAKFDSLIAVIDSNGKAADDVEHNERVFESGSVKFSHRILQRVKEKVTTEAVTVADFRTNIFYWVIKKDGTVSVETKDYTPEVAQRKYEQAKMHYENLLKSMLKDLKEK